MYLNKNSIKSTIFHRSEPLFNYQITKLKTYFTIASEAILLTIYKNNPIKIDQIRLTYSKKIVAAAGATLEIHGELESDVDLIVANHQSLIDIFSIESLVGNDVRFVGRAGIMDKWPVSVGTETVGHITIDLSDKRSIIHLIKEVKSKKGKKVVIFPEGTRNQTGKIEKFENGTRLIAEKLDLKVQPIVLTNITSVFDEKNRYAKAGTIGLHILPVVNRTDENWYAKLYEDMQATFLQFNN